ncbi:MAG: molybdopterin molybdotransferase MoeA [Azoarcus sp.]|jgi:molybdopterin molybdotransferase|nr:molybdopterin molybdotransferase MoeA [Azoarcus sp.]
MNGKSSKPASPSLSLPDGLSVRDAQACILGKTAPLGTEDIALERALGRVLAADVRADRDLPPHDISAMDGYAACAADTADAPARLKIVDDIRAGDTPRVTLQRGQCARIMTGAPVPAGADTVVRVEDTRPGPEDTVDILVPVQAATDIRRRAENMRRGEIVLAAGTGIGPGTVGALATAKQATVAVHRQPRVAILSSGNELEALHEPFDPGKIPDANTYALMAQVQAQGVEPDLLGIARDDPAELSGFLEWGLGYDLLLVSGGTSVGVHDHVRPTLAALGVAMHFWRVEMRPGHPVAFGTLGRCFVFCLPGNPVSSMVCFEQFVLPALRALAGHRRLFRRTLSARLTHAVKSKPGRIEFMRVTLARNASGIYEAASAGSQSSGDMLSMARADGLLIVPSASKGLAAGETARVQLLETGAYQDEAELGDEKERPK